MGKYRNTATSREIQNFVRFFTPVNREFSRTERVGGKKKHFTIPVPEFQPNYKPPLTFTQHAALRHILLPCRVSINSLPNVSITNNSYCAFFFHLLLLAPYCCTIVKSFATVFTNLWQKNYKSDVFLSILTL